jgi:hypothetical protein
LIECANFFAAELVKRGDWRSSTPTNKLFKRKIIGNAEVYLVRFLRGNFYSADHAIIETAMQAGDQAVPIILDKLSPSSHPASDRVNDFVLESGQRFAGREERVGRVTVRIRRPSQYRLSLHADRTQHKAN